MAEPPNPTKFYVYKIIFNVNGNVYTSSTFITDIDAAEYLSLIGDQEEFEKVDSISVCVENFKIKLSPKTDKFAYIVNFQYSCRQLFNKSDFILKKIREFVKNS